MRRSLFLYLFVFAGLLALFQYVSAEKMLESKNDEIADLKEELAAADKKVDTFPTGSVSYFSLSDNEDAISYFESRGFHAPEIAQRVKDKIRSKNSASEDNELVPYEGMEGLMRINKIKILNHKWVLADFTDGTYWGELFITYSIDDSGNISLSTEKSFLYPKNN